MQRSKNWAWRVVAWCAVPSLAVSVAGAASAGHKQAKHPAPVAAAPATPTEPSFTPGVTIMPEILTPEGKPRLYPVGGGRESVWQPGMPVYIGDRVILRAFVTTGPATLKEMRIRLDNDPVQTLAKAPWVTEVDTGKWQPGYHFAEVFAQSSDSRAPLGSATAVFVVRPPLPVQPKPVAAATRTTTTKSKVTETQETVTTPATPTPSRETPETMRTPPAHPGNPVPVQNGIPQYQAALDVTIHASDPAIDRAVTAHNLVRVTAPTVFRVSAGPRARRFVYALTRQGKEIYRSQPLPISSLVRLQPKASANGVGLNPGELLMWVWAGDDQGNYGAPDMVHVEIVPQS